MVQNRADAKNNMSLEDPLTEVILPGLGPDEGHSVDFRGAEIEDVEVDLVESIAFAEAVITELKEAIDAERYSGDVGGATAVLEASFDQDGSGRIPIFPDDLDAEDFSSPLGTPTGDVSVRGAAIRTSDGTSTEFGDEVARDVSLSAPSSTSQSGSADALGDDGDNVADEPMVLYGTSADDVLSGGNADDTLYGAGGDDSLFGGKGDDRLLGEWNNDALYGEGGDDFLFGSYGNDSQWGGEGNDEVRGGYGNDSLHGGAGDDFVHGYNGNDTLSGGAGSDILDGGTGNDIYIADSGSGTGDDVILDSDGSEVLQFEGHDPFAEIWQVSRQGDSLVFDYDDGGSLTITDFYGIGYIEKATHDGQSYLLTGDASVPVSFADFIVGNPDQYVEGTDGADVLSAGSGDDFLYGLAGDDDLSSGGGTDTVYAGHGDDVADGGDGADVLYGGFGDDALYGGEGDDRLLGEYDNDRLYGQAGDDYLFGSYGNDSQWGGDGADNVRGGYGNDILSGDAGDDIVDGFNGNDVLDGGAGNDTLSGGTGHDTFLMKRGYGADVISDFATLSAGALYADKIDLSDFGITGFDDLVKEDTADGDALIHLGDGDQLSLVGVGSDDLQDADFLF